MIFIEELSVFTDSSGRSDVLLYGQRPTSLGLR